MLCTPRCTPSPRSSRPTSPESDRGTVPGIASRTDALDEVSCSDEDISVSRAVPTDDGGPAEIAPVAMKKKKRTQGFMAKVESEVVRRRARRGKLGKLAGVVRAKQQNETYHSLFIQLDDVSQTHL